MLGQHNNLKYTKIVMLMAAFWLLASCANMQPPSGGPQDQTPPTLLFATPTPYSTQYSGRVITLTFDERLKLNKPRENVIISPYTDIKYSFKTRRNSVIFTFDKPLPKNKTYYIDFGQAIGDVTEDNKAENINLLFSTGPQLDTLTLQGKVTIAKNGQTPDNALVGLYHPADTGNIYTAPPRYLARPDNHGHFFFNGLAPGTYYLQAWTEKRPDNHYGPGEYYAFASDSITLDTAQEQPPANLLMFFNNDQPPTITQQDSAFGGTRLTANRGLISLKATDTANNPLTAIPMGNNGNLFTVLRPNHTTDSLPALITITDSIYNTTTDTLMLHFEPWPPDSLFMKRDTTFAYDTTQTQMDSTLYALKQQGKWPHKKYFVTTDTLPNPTNQNNVINNDTNTLLIDSTVFKITPRVIKIDSALVSQLTEFEPGQGAKIGPGKWIEVNFEIPVDTIKPNYALGVADNTIITNPQQTPNNYQWNQNKTQLKIKVPNDAEQHFMIKLKPNTLINYFGVANEPDSLNYPILTELETGVIRGQVTSFEGPAIIQLLNKKNEVITQQYGGPSFVFTDLKPGLYFVRAIEDLNQNKIWDTGSLKKQIQPEPIFFYPKEIDLKANWEIEGIEP